IEETFVESLADDPCTICLGEIIDAAHTDGCLHTFCFRCIQRWSASRAACPLCRTPFGRILHTVRSCLSPLTSSQACPADL
uniref:RING-type E3 ubiquitin transferase n=1 Tax=Bubo bubo TaxID=30461 RepID=A0A8C0FTI4_BUBBB